MLMVILMDDLDVMSIMMKEKIENPHYVVEGAFERGRISRAFEKLYMKYEASKRLLDNQKKSNAAT